MQAEIVGWIAVALGVLLAFTGTKLFWLAVGIAGFAFGWLVSAALFSNIDPFAQALVGLVLGVACAAVAIKGLPIIGFALGAVLVGLLGMSLFRYWFDGSTLWRFIGFVLGALVGYFIVKLSLEVGIALVTALGGGTIIWNGVLEALPSIAPWVAAGAGLAAAVVGFIVQMGARNKDTAGSGTAAAS